MGYLPGLRQDVCRMVNTVNVSGTERERNCA